VANSVMTDPGEWLETDGCGGFASAPVWGPRTRRYHALLLAAAGAQRFVLVNGAEAAVDTAAGTWQVLDVQRYVEGPRPPAMVPESFSLSPWPRWVYALPDGTRMSREVFQRHGRAETFIRWRLLDGPAGPVSLRVRPFLSGRDYHALHHENWDFRFHPERRGEQLVFRPYDGVPPISVTSNGAYRHEPYWYRRFFYAEEAARGLDAEEDLAAPGELLFDLRAGDGRVILAANDAPAGDWQSRFEETTDAERARRLSFPSPLHRSADQFVVERMGGKTIIAGYPWFTDWGRDTFISVRGLCLATGRLDDARDILLRWADAVSDGMLPNCFPDGGGPPVYNSVDAALWYVVAAHELMVAGGPHERLRGAIERILAGHLAGTRHSIRVTADGLLAAGERGVQLTWMDAKVDDRVVTPRVGKPVEVQALWVNALWVGAQLGVVSRELLEHALASFRARFWNEARGCLFDVVDVDHVEGATDGTLRPNQIFAVGGLPLPLLDGERARRVVDAVEAHLLTPVGLRSLAPGEPGYQPRYTGTMRERDRAYHQGTVWPWLMGPFVEAWVRVRGPGAVAEARRRFLAPLQAHLGEPGIGHLSEVASAEPPHVPGGCPFQAWSLAELLRLELQVLAPQRGKLDAPAVALAR
jgi:predicted glycogen debranching enzyme